MNIQTHNPIFNNPRVSAPQVQVQNENPQPPENNNDNYDNRKELDEKNFSWTDLGKGVAGAVIGGAVEGVGIGASSLVRGPQVAAHTLKAVWKSKMLGPVLKSTLTPVIIAAGLASPVFAAIGGMGYGMFEGFKEGAEKNPLAAASAGVNTIKQFHNELAGKAVEFVKDAAQQEPESADQVYEIKVIEAGKGLVGSAGAAAVVGGGAALSTAVNLIPGYVKVSGEIWKSDVALPLKVGGQILATGAAVLAVPFAAAGGVLYGLGTGAYNGYKDGVIPAVVKGAKDVGEYHKAASDAIYDN